MRRYDVPVDSHIVVYAILRLDFDTIRELCPLASLAVSEDAGGVFSLPLQKLIGITKRNSVLAAIAYALD